MTVSLCIIAYNEEKTADKLLDCVLSQTYPKEKTEILLVDSASSDGTRSVFEDFAKVNSNESLSVRVLDNPRRSQAAGWNTAIGSAEGDIIIRVDAHAEIPSDFVENNVKLIQSGEYVCGGARPCRIEDPTPMREMLFLAESSMFGSSPAGYRRKSGEKKYVDSVFHGAYRREVFAKVGGFNEELGRTEDNELHYRIRSAGYKICQSGDIISYQNIRSTLGSMLRQKYGNGKWIGLTLGVCFGCISFFHLVPFFFVFTFICSLLLFVSAFITGNLWMIIPFAGLMGLYGLADLGMTVLAAVRSDKKHPLQLLLPFVFFLLHFSYGIGTAVGFVTFPFWRASVRKNNRITGISAKDRIEEVRQKVIQNTKTTDQEASD